MAKLHQQPGALAANKPTTSISADPQKEMDWDRTYTKEGSEQHHTTGLKMESPKGKGGVVDQGTPGENQLKMRCPRGTQLAHTCSDGTEQSQMEGDCQWPILCTRVKRHKSSKSWANG